MLSIRNDAHAATYDALPCNLRGSRPRPREWGVVISKSPSSNPTSQPGASSPKALSKTREMADGTVLNGPARAVAVQVIL